MPDTLPDAMLFLALVYLGVNVTHKWLKAITGLGIIAVSIEMVIDHPAYGLPYMLVGFGVFLLGVTGKKI